MYATNRHEGKSMDFSITEEQRSLLARLDCFCQENLQESEIQQWITAGGVPDSFMLKYYKEGFGRIGLPEDIGGVDASVVTRVLVLERLAMHAGATLPAQSLMTYTHFVSDIANDQQIKLLREDLESTGKLPFSFAISEPQSGSKTFDVHTEAIELPDEGGFVINGSKSFVSSGQYSPYIVLIANDPALGVDSRGHDPLTFFLVPRDAEGVDTFPMSKIGQRLIPSADILLENVHVGYDAVMGKRGSGSDELLRSFEYGRVYVCATTVGMAQAAFNEAVSFALNRSITGSSILSFQQVQQMIVDMQVKIDAMRAFLYKTAYCVDGGEGDPRLESALLKRFVPKTAMEVADSAIQIMGGLGYRSSTRTARVWEECRGNRIAQGTDEVMTVIASKRIVNRAADELLDPPVWRF